MTTPRLDHLQLDDTENPALLVKDQPTLSQYDRVRAVNLIQKSRAEMGGTSGLKKNRLDIQSGMVDSDGMDAPLGGSGNMELALSQSQGAKAELLKMTEKSEQALDGQTLLRKSLQSSLHANNPNIYQEGYLMAQPDRQIST